MRSLLVTTLLISLLTVRPCMADQQNERYVGAAGHSAMGAAMYGFALSVTSDASTVQLGSPMWVTLEIRNVSGNTEYAQFPPRGAFEFSIANQTSGKMVPRNLLSTFGLDSIGGPPEGIAVPVNTSLYLRFRLDKLYQFTKRGTYSVRVTTAHLNIKGEHELLLPSNTISITVL